MQPELIGLNSKLKGSILVVDDDEGVRRVLSRWTEDLGYRVRAAADADQAMAAMQDSPVDVALCDVRMPGRDGIWLVDQLLRSYPNTSIVLATGLVELDPALTLRAGVVGYIVKPFNRTELDDVIQRGLAACRERSSHRPAHPSRPAPADAVGRTRS